MKTNRSIKKRISSLSQASCNPALVLPRARVCGLAPRKSHKFISRTFLVQLPEAVFERETLGEVHLDAKSILVAWSHLKFRSQWAAEDESKRKLLELMCCQLKEWWWAAVSGKRIFAWAWHRDGQPVQSDLAVCLLQNSFPKGGLFSAWSTD